MALPLIAAGCTVKTSTTQDLAKVEVDVPKIEVKQTPDLDLRTDDVDVRTPTARP